MFTLCNQVHRPRWKSNRHHHSQWFVSGDWRIKWPESKEKIIQSDNLTFYKLLSFHSNLSLSDYNSPSYTSLSFHFSLGNDLRLIILLFRQSFNSSLRHSISFIIFTLPQTMTGPIHCKIKVEGVEARCGVPYPPPNVTEHWPGVPHCPPVR